MQPAYQRILLKLSGEAFTSANESGINPAILDQLAQEIAAIVSLGVEVGIVIGGGNLFRGKILAQAGIERITADHMGMLATTMNSLALRDALERINTPCIIMSALPMTGVVDPYDRRKAVHRLKQKRVLIFSSGTGNPLFTTDSAASLRAIEINADLLLKATNVDGIYSADPIQNSDVTLYQQLTYQEVLEKELGVMDLAAFCQCRDYNVPLRVFRMSKPNALLRIIQGQQEGTLVTNSLETRGEEHNHG